MFSDYQRLYQLLALAALMDYESLNGNLWSKLCPGCKHRHECPITDQPICEESLAIVDSWLHVFIHKRTGDVEVLCAKAKS